MANPDRLTGLDSSFLHLERDAAHMHVAGCMVFEGPAPDYGALVDQIVSRLHLVPRYRQRLALVPLNQGRPVWVDDPHFNPGFHVRHAALPAPGDEAQLKRLAPVAGFMPPTASPTARFRAARRSRSATADGA